MSFALTGLPYLKTDCGYFVEVEVTVEGVRLSQIHPVLDARNKPIEMPSAFDINTSIQRCLVKAIALHGLGLYVYAGEDLPQPQATDTPAANDEHRSPGQETPRTTVRPQARAPLVPTITKTQQAQIHKLAIEVGVAL